MFPVDPNDIKVQRRYPARDLCRAKAAVVAQQRRNLLLVSITNGLASEMRLEERGCGVGGHALRWLGVKLTTGKF